MKSDLTMEEYRLMRYLLECGGDPTFIPSEDCAAADLEPSEAEAACARLRDRGWLALHALADGTAFWAIVDSKIDEIELENWDL